MSWHSKWVGARHCTVHPSVEWMTMVPMSQAVVKREWKRVGLKMWLVFMA